MKGKEWCEVRLYDQSQGEKEKERMKEGHTEVQDALKPDDKGAANSFNFQKHIRWWDSLILTCIFATELCRCEPAALFSVLLPFAEKVVGVNS